MSKIKRKGEAGQPTKNAGHFAQKTHDDETVTLRHTPADVHSRGFMQRPRPEFVPSSLHRAPVGSSAVQSGTPFPMRSFRRESEVASLDRSRADRAANGVAAEPDSSYIDAAADTTDEQFFIESVSGGDSPL